jgi:hypothetical protein
MAEQLVFDLPVRPAMGRDDFFVTGSNAAALAQVDGWRDWPFGKLVLVGPEGAGKTHLAHVWAAGSGARHRWRDRGDEAEILRADATAPWRWRMPTGWRATGRRDAALSPAQRHAQRGAPVLFTARAARAMGPDAARSGQPDAAGGAGADRGAGRCASVGAPAEAGA